MKAAQESSFAKERFKLCVLLGIGFGEVTVQEGSGGKVDQLRRADDVELRRRDGFPNDTKSLEELRAAFADKLGSDKEDSVGTIVLVEVGLGEVG